MKIPVKEKLYFTPRAYTTLSRMNSLSLNYSGSYFLYYLRTKNPFTDSTNTFNSCFNVDSPWSFPHVPMLHWLAIWCRDGVNVLWCHSRLVSLVCFHSENIFVTCSCCFFCCFFCFVLFHCNVLNGKREERWEGRPRGRCMLHKVW